MPQRHGSLCRCCKDLTVGVSSSVRYMTRDRRCFDRLMLVAAALRVTLMRTAQSPPTLDSSVTDLTCAGIDRSAKRLAGRVHCKVGRSVLAASVVLSQLQ